MTAGDIRYAMDTSTLSDVLAHLGACDAGFVPSLSARVDVAAYAAKLVDRARRIEAWHGGELIGLAAAYVNDVDRVWFVTNVSTHPSFTRRGIASRLLAELLAHADRSEVRLEVAKHNAAARALYESMDFVVDSEADDVLTLLRASPLPLRNSQSR